MSEADAGADISITDPLCMQRKVQAQTLIGAASMSAGSSCSVDADCSFADNSSDGSSGCGVLVNRDEATALASAIERANTTICVTPKGRCRETQAAKPSAMAGRQARAKSST
ncbi:MAG TPA: hypothetical protein VGI70_13040 [Polyangiales bacterium]